MAGREHGPVRTSGPAVPVAGQRWVRLPPGRHGGPKEGSGPQDGAGRTDGSKQRGEAPVRPGAVRQRVPRESPRVFTVVHPPSKELV